MKANRLNISKLVYILSLVVGYFLLQIKFTNDAWFGTDELDIMMVGKGIARGQRLYIDAISQHMPLSYFISALFYKLGAVSVTEQRLAFYLFFSLLWTFVVIEYSNIIDKRVLILYPIIYCSVIQNYDMGTAILSEHIAGCGAIILFLEFLKYVRCRRLETRSCVFISIAIFLMFGTIFVAIYPIFFIAVGVLLLEIKWEKEKAISIRDWINCIFKKYVKLVLIVMIPWIVLIGYFIITHSFSEFIFGAYTLNREIYPKYNGGLGNNIFSVFLTPIDMICSFVTNGFNLNEWNYVVVLQWIIILCCIFYFYKLMISEGKLVASTAVFFTFALGIRGIFNFHGTACVKILTFMTAYVLIVYGFQSFKRFQKKSVERQMLFVFMIVIMLSGYLKDISEIMTIKFEETGTVQSHILETITEKDESVWLVVFDNSDTMLSDRIAVGTATNTPWTWEGFGKKTFKALKKNTPRVAVFSEEFEVWGHKQSVYAPEVIQFIKENYTLLPDTGYIYVLNDYYEEAVKKIENSNH